MLTQTDCWLTLHMLTLTDWHYVVQHWKLTDITHVDLDRLTLCCPTLKTDWHYTWWPRQTDIMLSHTENWLTLHMVTQTDWHYVVPHWKLTDITRQTDYIHDDPHCKLTAIHKLTNRQTDHWLTYMLTYNDIWLTLHVLNQSDWH